MALPTNLTATTVRYNLTALGTSTPPAIECSLQVGALSEARVEEFMAIYETHLQNLGEALLQVSGVSSVSLHRAYDGTSIADIFDTP